MELHPEYPPPLPHHLPYDYTTSMELMSQYSGGAPMSFQMQTQMLSRLHQMRAATSANGTAAPPPGDAPPPGASYHLHGMPPPPPPPHHAYMDQEGGAGTHYDQDHRYMPHMPYAYPDPHTGQLPPPHHPHSLPPPPSAWPPAHVLPQHYPSHYPPPPFGALSSADGEQYGAAAAAAVADPQVSMLAQSPHEATVQLVMATLIEEMKNIMQRDLKRKMVENIAFGTFDEWWERKERKAKVSTTADRKQKY